MRKRKRIRKRQVRKKGHFLPKAQLALRSCAITWIMLMICFGLLSVEYQAVVSGYAKEETLLSVSREEPLKTEIILLGDRYSIDWTPVNQMAQLMQPYFALIPAPFRLPYQLGFYGEERYREYQKEQREREFIENI